MYKPQDNRPDVTVHPKSDFKSEYDVNWVQGTLRAYRVPRRSGRWADYERGKQVCQMCGLPDNCWGWADKIIADWVGV